MAGIQFSLEYHGLEADSNRIEFYDIAQALAGFQRSLAITTHLVLNGDVITQAPALKGARIFVTPAEAGSWKINSTVILGATALYTIGTADRETPLGHLVSSAYDYVISETMGFHVDYDKSLGQSYDELKAQQQNEVPIIEQSQLDSVIEKCEASIVSMHRPLIWSRTASNAVVQYKSGRESTPIGPAFTPETYAFVSETNESLQKSAYVGRVSSYNLNTFKGRIFIPKIGRPISFELMESAQNVPSISLITDSLRLNARNRANPAADILIQGYELTSRTLILKKINIISVGKPEN